MANLKVEVAGVPFKNPVIPASGAFGFGWEYSRMYDIAKLGGISCKGTTLEERQGNPPPRIAETPSGMLNSVGLQNPGIDAFIAQELPRLEKIDITIIANIAGSAIEDYCMAVEKLNDTAVDMIELNISCPNVKEGGVAFGICAESAENIVSKVRKVCQKPLMVKLTPNVTDITEIAKAVEFAGADALSLINTLTGMRINIHTRRPILRNNTGGLSGPAVFPVAVRMVWQVANSVNLPIIGMGGIASWQDAIEMMMAGASAIQIGAALFTDPYAPLKIIEGMNTFLDENNIENISDIVGTVKPW